MSIFLHQIEKVFPIINTISKEASFKRLLCTILSLFKYDIHLPILSGFRESQRKYTISPLELDTAYIVRTSQRFKVEVVMGDPPRVVLLQTVHHYSVGSQIRNIRICVITSIFVYIYNLKYKKTITT